MSLALTKSFVALIVLTLVAVGCGGESASNGLPGYSANSEDVINKPTIRLATNNGEPELVTAILAASIESYLRYPVVIVGAAGGGSSDVSASVDPQVAANELTTSRLSLEDAGALGLSAGTGWFISNRTKAAFPNLESWQAFSTPEVSAAFISGDSGSNARLMVNGSSSPIDAALIGFVGLPITADYFDSSDALAQEVIELASQDTSVLISTRVPSMISARFQLSPITTPELQSCAGVQGTCAHSLSPARKYISDDLGELAPEVDALVRNFTLTNEDITSLRENIEAGDTVAEVGLGWAQGNQAKLETWLS